MRFLLGTLLCASAGSASVKYPVQQSENKVSTQTRLQLVSVCPDITASCGVPTTEEAQVSDLAAALECMLKVDINSVPAGSCYDALDAFLKSHAAAHPNESAQNGYPTPFMFPPMTGFPERLAIPGLAPIPGIMGLLNSQLPSDTNPRLPPISPNAQNGPRTSPNGPPMGPNGMDPNDPIPTTGPNGMVPTGPVPPMGPNSMIPHGPPNGPIPRMGPSPNGRFHPMGPNSMSPNVPPMGPDTMSPFPSMGPNGMGPNGPVPPIGPKGMAPNGMGPNGPAPHMGPNGIGSNGPVPPMGPDGMGPDGPLPIPNGMRPNGPVRSMGSFFPVGPSPNDQAFPVGPNGPFPPRNREGQAAPISSQGPMPIPTMDPIFALMRQMLSSQGSTQMPPMGPQSQMPQALMGPQMQSHGLMSQFQMPPLRSRAQGQMQVPPMGPQGQMWFSPFRPQVPMQVPFIGFQDQMQVPMDPMQTFQMPPMGPDQMIPMGLYRGMQQMAGSALPFSPFDDEQDPTVAWGQEGNERKRFGRLSSNTGCEHKQNHRSGKHQSGLPPLFPQFPQGDQMPSVGSQGRMQLPPMGPSMGPSMGLQGPPTRYSDQVPPVGFNDQSDDKAMDSNAYGYDYNGNAQPQAFMIEDIIQQMMQAGTRGQQPMMPSFGFPTQPGMPDQEQSSTEQSAEGVEVEAPSVSYEVAMPPRSFFVKEQAPEQVSYRSLP